MAAALNPVPSPPTSPVATRPAPSAPTASSAPREALVRDRGSVFRETVRADRWIASGSVKVLKDIDVGTGQVQGTTTLGGRLVADEFRARGTIEIEGEVEVRGALTTSGVAHFGAAVRAVDLTIGGSARFAARPLVGRALTVRGALVAPAVTAGLFRVDGSVDIPGEAVAQQVDATLRRTSRLGLVRAPEVRIHGRRPTIVDKAFFHTLWTRVDRIEADRVDLSEVTVSFVRAGEIVLGRGAHLAEYEGTIVRRHPTSSVGFESKTPPPYGLRR